ncbi:MAG: hypothetical protein SWY16_19690 [Cyanobacteriota bacterium]|nr:hypothetical protein [Cyanobacteriota bacterium]
MKTVLTYYTIGAFIVFTIWLSLFWDDRKTPIGDKNSWLVLLVATLGWPIALPLSIIELSGKKRKVSDFAPHYLPVGQFLKQAGLLTQTQIGKALQEQKTQPDSQRFGEILVRRGWLAQETVDFFVDDLPGLKFTPQKQRLGDYLKAAKLLDDTQIELILVEQRQTQTRFGEMAVRKGWLDRKTLDLLLYYLVEEREDNELASST